MTPWQRTSSSPLLGTASFSLHVVTSCMNDPGTRFPWQFVECGLRMNNREGKHTATACGAGVGLCDQHCCSAVLHP